jgi:GTPase SAR1 family protein
MWKSILKHFKLNNKDRDRRFRVLILGPANAGKTTLLERLTDSPAGAAIVRRKGKRVITTDVRTQ